jgi:hypothetical protein
MSNPVVSGGRVAVGVWVGGDGVVVVVGLPSSLPLPSPFLTTAVTPTPQVSQEQSCGV